MSNPYATPIQGAPQQPNRKGVADGLVKPPAIALIVVSVIGFLGMTGYLILTLIGLSSGGVEIPPAADEAERIGQQIGLYGVVIGMAVNALLQLLILFAGICMLKRTNYTICMLGTITAAIPFLGSSCCLLGLPFAIWSFVILLNQDVKASFR